jgi:hypothetical protein
MDTINLADLYALPPLDWSRSRLDSTTPGVAGRIGDCRELGS